MKYLIPFLLLFSVQLVADDEFEEFEDFDLEDGRPLEYFLDLDHYSTSFTYEDINLDTVVVFINHGGDVFGTAIFAGGDLGSANYTGAAGQNFETWYAANYYSVNWLQFDTGAFARQ